MVKIEIIGTTLDIRCYRCRRKKSGIFFTSRDGDAFCQECIEYKHVSKLFIKGVKDMNFVGDNNENKKNRGRSSRSRLSRS